LSLASYRFTRQLVALQSGEAAEQGRARTHRG